MAKHRQARGAGEASVPPVPSSSERERLEAAVASLSGLNADQLRLQWRNHLRGIAPAHLPGWLLARVLAYRIQAAAFGDLDRAILRRLREMKGEALESGQAPPFATRGPTTRESVASRPLSTPRMFAPLPDEQEWQDDRRRIDLAWPSLLDPVEPDLCRTAAPQRADP
jgi:hypothetical protein